MGSGVGAELLADRLIGVVKIRECVFSLLGAGLHFREAIGRELAAADGDKFDAPILVGLGEIDEPFFVEAGHRAVIAGERDHNEFGLLEIGEAVLLFVGSAEILPGRSRITDIEDFVELGSFDASVSSHEGERQDPAGRGDFTKHAVILL